MPRAGAAWARLQGGEAPAEKKHKSSRPGIDILNKIRGVQAAPAVAAPVGTAISASSLEFSSYMTEPPNGDVSPLEWWRQKEGTYPPCPSERLFSVAGNVLTAKRACLSDDMLDALTSLHGNQDLTKKSVIPVVAADFDA
jgi:hypothetical protein